MDKDFKENNVFKNNNPYSPLLITIGGDKDFKENKYVSWL